MENQLISANQIVGKRVKFVKSLEPEGQCDLIVGFDDDTFVVFGINRQYESCDDSVEIIGNPEYFTPAEKKRYVNGV